MWPAEVGALEGVRVLPSCCRRLWNGRGCVWDLFTSGCPTATGYVCGKVDRVGPGCDPSTPTSCWRLCRQDNHHSRSGQLLTTCGVSSEFCDLGKLMKEPDSDPGNHCSLSPRWYTLKIMPNRFMQSGIRSSKAVLLFSGQNLYLSTLLASVAPDILCLNTTSGRQGCVSSTAGVATQFKMCLEQHI